MTIQTKPVDYVPATQKEGTVEYENTIKAFEKSPKLSWTVYLSSDDTRDLNTIASGLRRALQRMGSKYEHISVKQRMINKELQVFLEKKEK